MQYIFRKKCETQQYNGNASGITRAVQLLPTECTTAQEVKPTALDSSLSLARSRYLLARLHCVVCCFHITSIPGTNAMWQGSPILCNSCYWLTGCVFFYIRAFSDDQGRTTDRNSVPARKLLSESAWCCGLGLKGKHSMLFTGYPELICSGGPEKITGALWEWRMLEAALCDFLGGKSLLAEAVKS